MSNVYYVVWDSIPDEEKANTEQAAALLDGAYRNPRQPIDVNFTNVSARYAYYYLNFTSTVYCVSSCWGKFHLQSPTLDRLLNDLINQGEVKILSLGGSGSDLVGFCHWIGSRDFRLRVASVVVDKYDWFAERSRILPRFQMCTQRGSENPEFLLFDFVNVISYVDTVNPLITELDAGIKFQIKRAEVFSIVKFLSTLPMNLVAMQEKLTEVFRLLQKAALVMYMDIIDNEFTGVINIAANNAGLRPVGYIRNVKIEVHEHEAAAMGAHFLPQFQPLQVEHLATSLWQK